MRTDEFDYDLPDELIARSGIEPRDAARLLVDRSTGIEHRHISDIPSLVGPGDVVVVNDTRVLPARIRFRRQTGGAGELLLLEHRGGVTWEALARPSAKLPPGTVVPLSGRVEVEMGDDLGDGRRLVNIEVEGDLATALGEVGEMPTPPYLGDIDLADPDRYQTVYANAARSAAAPTAGLHLNESVLEGIEAAGATVERVELAVGLDTFRPITTDEVEDHQIHSERYEVDAHVWERIAAARRVVAVGTTTVRTLESVAATGRLSGRTDLFIRPGFEFAVTDVLMTNFHLPRSSLLVMIEAFIGPRWRDLYAQAIEAEYRMLSFGDAMWLTRGAT